MTDLVFDDPFDDSIEDIRRSLFEQVELLWPDASNRPDLREGSLMWTLLSPLAFEIQRFQNDLNIALELGFIQFSTGTYLDLKGVELGLERRPGVHSTGNLRFLGGLGITVPMGTTASTVPDVGIENTYSYDTLESGTLEGEPNPTDIDEVQTVQATGVGRFTVTFDGQTTNPLALTATGSQIADELNNLAPTPSYTTYTVSGDSGLVAGSGGTVTFGTGDVAAKDIPALEINPYFANEVQTVQVAGSGTFGLTFDGAETVTTLDETSTAQNIIDAINALSPSSTYDAFSVSTPNAAAVVGDPAGVTIVFDDGGVEHEDVDELQVTSVTGTIVGSVNTVSEGENSTIASQVIEVAKGRRGEPLVTINNQNEIQRMSYRRARTLVTTTQNGQPGPRNEIHRLSFGGVPPSNGEFTLTFDNGVSSHTTTPIEWGPSTGLNAIQTALTNLPNVNSGDIEVTLVSGGPSLDDGNAVFDIEYKGNLRFETYGLLVVGDRTGDFAPVGSSATSISVIRQQVGANGQNEVQRVEYEAGIAPSSGEFALTFRDVGTGASETLNNIPYNVTAGQLQGLLETLTTFANGNDPSGTNFSVLGGPIDAAPIFIEFTGKNRYTNFHSTVVTSNFVGTPTSGNFRLTFNDGSSIATTGAIDHNASTHDVEDALEALANVGSNNVAVKVANGVQTIQFASGTPTSGNFTLTIDDGVTAETTDPIAFDATAATVEAEIEALANVSGVVVDSDSTTLDQGAVYTLHFADPTVTYKHLAVPFNGLSPATSVVVGPNLDVAGVGYEVEFIGSLANTNLAKMVYDTGTLTLSPQPNLPTIETITDGGVGINERQILSISHPSGFFKLGFGLGSPNRTHFISPLFDTPAMIKRKLEALGAIAVDDVAISGSTIFGSGGSGEIVVEFIANLAGTDLPNMTTHGSTVAGGEVVGPIEVQKGFGGAGTVVGDVRYGYTFLTKLGVQDGSDDADFESGFGETGLSALTSPLTVSNNSILLTIDPVISQGGVQDIRRVNLYRSLNNGPFRLIGSLNEASISYTSLDNEAPVQPMYFVDNVSAANFSAITTSAPTSNMTGVVDIPAQAQETGGEQNVPARTIEFLEDFITGIERVTNPQPFGGGFDLEGDESYRQRLIEKAQEPPGAGNVAAYIRWAKEVPGIENVAVLPEWQETYGPLNGPGTVKVVVSGSGSTLLPADKIEEVRQYIAGTIAIPDPNQTAAPAAGLLSGGSIEDGIYEYVYTFINVGKGETAPSPPARVVVGGSGNNTVELFLTRGQTGIGVQNTIGRRIYRRKVDGALSGEPESDRFVLVAEVLNNTDTVYEDSAAYADLPTWSGFPEGPYQRRKAPLTNSTSLFDGEAPVGAHVTVESITDETVWVNATIYPEFGYSVDGSQGTVNLTTELNNNLTSFFGTLESGQDVLIKNVENVIHDHPGVRDFKDVVLVSPAFPTGTTENIPIGDGVVAQYSTAGSFSTWMSYPYDP